MLLRKEFEITSVQKDITEWGEFISCIINNQFKLFCVYRHPSSNPKEILPLFNELYNTNMPTVLCGDFNWEHCHMPTKEGNLGIKSVRECTHLGSVLTKSAIMSARRI